MLAAELSWLLAGLAQQLDWLAPFTTVSWTLRLHGDAPGVESQELGKPTPATAMALQATAWLNNSQEKKTKKRQKGQKRQKKPIKRPKDKNTDTH